MWYVLAAGLMVAISTGVAWQVSLRTRAEIVERFDHVAETVEQVKREMER